MTKKTPASTSPPDDLIRDFAYLIYLQDGRIEGNDLSHWLEAKAYLASWTPPSQ